MYRKILVQTSRRYPRKLAPFIAKIPFEMCQLSRISMHILIWSRYQAISPY